MISSYYIKTRKTDEKRYTHSHILKDTDFTTQNNKNHLIENYLSECQILDLAANHFKATIINMFKNLKETTFKELYKGMIPIIQ